MKVEKHKMTEKNSHVTYKKLNYANTYTSKIIRKKFCTNRLGTAKWNKGNNFFNEQKSENESGSCSSKIENLLTLNTGNGDCNGNFSMVI